MRRFFVLASLFVVMGACAKAASDDIPPDNGVEAMGYSAGVVALTSFTNQIGNVTRYTYDRDDNVIQFKDNHGSVQHHHYDALNRRVRTDVTRALGVIGTTRDRQEAERRQDGKERSHEKVRSDE